uniref:Predicted protein n=1 Tax=Hordeum vulgare subsp. vulgare TaxID=112509 RepID=F2DYD3_HORVV|nr:predicted protein [Hordeum vulgare subsp. vulgare]
MGKREKDQKKKKAAKVAERFKTKTEEDVEEVEEGVENLEVDESATGEGEGGEVAPSTPSAKPNVEAEKKERERKILENPRSCTGVLSSQVLSRDLKIENFSMSLYGVRLIDDTRLEFNWGRKYGLLGPNGSGKSTLLEILGYREAPIPDHITIYHLDKEAGATDLSSLEWVIQDVDAERKRLEAEAEELSQTEEGANSDRIFDIYDSLDQLEADLAAKRAGEILHGLGFNKAMQAKKTKDFSGGWRMRIALAKALFAFPTMLLLDEPTNHLDLEACVWLEEYLKKYNRILVIISHSQDFLNNVCTNIIHLSNRKLVYYGGNYDTYVQTRAEKEENQMKQYNWEQEQISHMKEYIARFGHGSAKLAKQAQSKEKTLEKMKEKGLTERVVADRVLSFRFTNVGKLPPPVLTFNRVNFAYPGTSELIYKDLEFGIDLDSRIALVGPNGAGKSTLLKLMVGDVQTSGGIVRRHNHLKIGWYHQHLTDQLDLDLSPLEYMMRKFPGVELETMRRVVGRYGLSGKNQTMPIANLSDGQKSRVVFAWLAYQAPSLLLLDEPTNHLDMETIDALAVAINEFDGGMVLVSHDFRLINQVAQEIWVCENRTVTPWKGDIMEYKDHLKKKITS